MSTQITTAFVKQFSSNVQMLSQQKGSRLRQYVDEEPITGEAAFFDQIGVADYQEVTGRHGNTPQMDTPHSRRMVVPSGIEWGDMIDKFDKVMTLADFSSPYVRAGAYAIGRGIDDKIITAARGIARTGKEGGTNVVLPTTQKVAIDYVESGSAANSGLTIAKIRRTAKIFDDADVDPDLPRYFTISAQQKQDLLATTEVTSADYNSVKALVDGKVDTFMGFKFVPTQRNAKSSTTRYCIAFVQDAIKLGVNENMTTEIAKDPTKRFSWRAYLQLVAGAVRMEEAKVVEIACYEA